MKVVLCIFIMFSISHDTHANVLDLEYVREQFGKASSDKHVCQTMIALLSKVTESNVHLAYLGAYQAMWAKHARGAFNKLNTFNEGKRNIEEAVKESPNDIEIRMIRLSVQKNCPAFLFYHNNIYQDRQFLESSKDTVSSATLLRMINALLSE